MSPLMYFLIAWMIRREVFFGVLLSAQRGAAHGNNRIEAVVGAVDVHVLGDRTQAVGRVEVAVFACVVPGSP